MIHVELNALPNGDPDPTVHRKIGHLAIEDLTPDDRERADYVTAVIASDLDVREVHRVDGHLRRNGWVALLTRALDPETITTHSDDVAIATHAREVVRAALDARCALGHPLRELRRVTGRWSEIAEQVLRGRATQECDGHLCGGYAHGTVLFPADYQEALHAAAVAQTWHRRNGRDRR